MADMAFGIMAARVFRQARGKETVAAARPHPLLVGAIADGLALRLPRNKKRPTITIRGDLTDSLKYEVLFPR